MYVDPKNPYVEIYAQLWCSEEMGPLESKGGALLQECDSGP
jgi:hypothetical protein